MDIHTARLIRELKKGCTYRRIAEIYFSPQDPGYGNQGFGDELCFQAFKILYPEISKHPLEISYEENTDKQFNEENKSRLGNFYWWE